MTTDTTLADTSKTLPELSASVTRHAARLAVLGGSAAAFAIAVATFGARPAEAGGPPPAVSVIVAKKTPYYRHYSYTGRIRSLAIVNIEARVTGYLEKREFQEGGTVKKGQILFVIEQGPYEAALDKAEANVQQAKAKLENAKLALARAERLLHTPAGQQSTVDNDRATEESDAAAVAAARAQRETAAINYGYTMIRSPITGRIGPNLSSPGNVVGPGSGTMATIVSQDPMEVIFPVPVRDLQTLRDDLKDKGGLHALKLSITLPDGKRDKQTGHITYVSNQVSESTDTIAVHGHIPNPVIPALGAPRSNDRQLTSGEFVTVHLRVKKPTERIVVPHDAILTDVLGNYVLVVNDKNKVIRRNVTLASSNQSQAAIASGVKPGARIIVRGIESVHPGLVVKPRTVAGERRRMRRQA